MRSAEPLSPQEERARADLESFGYRVHEGAIPEDVAYRDALKVGKSIGERGRKELDRRAQSWPTSCARPARTSTRSEPAAADRLN